MTTGDPVATWCVAMRDKVDGGEKTVHVKCPEDCVTYTSISFGLLGFCVDSGPECLIFCLVSVLVLFLTLLIIILLIKYDMEIILCCKVSKKN